jgi:phospholipid/cholesterol/gamma-HCH transport system ATP-binding protein
MRTETEPILEVHDVSLHLGGRVIFQDLNLTLQRGERYRLLGASGSGKSLLLKICAGLLAPDQGRVIVEGIDLAAAAKETLESLRMKMGIVFQGSALISNMAIYDNVALPLRYHQRSSETEVRARVNEQMDLFGVDRKFDASIPAQVSLGMRKRVALARSLILEPELLLLDQPADDLSPEVEQRIRQILNAYQQRRGATFFEVAGEWPHDVPLPDRLGLLEDGRISAEGSIQEMQAYLEKMNNKSFHA